MSGPERVPHGPEGRLTRRAAILGMSLAAAGGLAGCGLPVDPTVRRGLEIDAVEIDPGTYVPPGPVPGMTPEEVLHGFLRAGAATGAALDNARAFLTEEARSVWEPGMQRTIISERPAPTIRRRRGRYLVETTVAARIDVDGRYALAPASEAATFEFGVERVAGEWRISWLQEDFGRLLQGSAVSRIYRRYPVHYAAIGWNTLVPDLRWIPRDSEATQLTRAQLGPVPVHLAGAVQTDPGARLRFDAVPVSEGAAVVDLRPEGLSADQTVRRAFAAQLVATLRRIPEVTEVSIDVGGTPLSLPGVEPPLETPEDLDFAERPSPTGTRVVLRSGDHVVPVPRAEVLAVEASDLRGRGTPFADVPEDWPGLGLSPDGTEVAAVSASGRELARWRDDGSTAPVEQFATALTVPRYDTYGVLWVGGLGAGSQRADRLWAINTALDTDDEGAVPSAVPAPWLEGRTPRSVMVSPDGACVAVISTGARGRDAQVHVSGIVREPNRLPTATSPEALRVAASLVDAVDLVWVSSTTLALLARRADDGEVLPMLAEVGGTLTTLPPVPRARYITMLEDERDLVVTDERGRSHVRLGARWQALPAGGALVPPAG